MTNGEKIRAGDDWELAIWIANFIKENIEELWSRNGEKNLYSELARELHWWLEEEWKNN